MKKFISILAVIFAFEVGAVVVAQTTSPTQNNAHSFKWSGKHQFTQPVLLPSFTTVQMVAVSNPQPGMIVLNTDSKALYFYRDTAWRKVGTPVP